MWIQQRVESFQEQVKTSQQQLQVELQPDLPTFVCDPSSLERILTELLNNACKYSPRINDRDACMG